MAEYIGPIEIPEITASGVFPLVVPFGAVREIEPSVVIHRFWHFDRLAEQRFWRGTGRRAWIAQFSNLRESERAALLDFWQTHKGSYQPFTLQINESNGTQSHTVRFAQPAIALQWLQESHWSGSVAFMEEPSTAPSYTIAQTATRFPPAALQTALLSQVQQIIPVLAITAGSYDIRLSDRRCTIGGILYQPRLLRWDGIEQSIDGAQDLAQFVLGNADRVFTQLANAVNLSRAKVRFGLYHVGTQIMVWLWTGEIASWSGGSQPEFLLRCDDGLPLRLSYPNRKITRQDGFVVPDQPVNVGGKKGISRITATSVANDSVYGRPLKDIYVDGASMPMQVECDIIAGRDESEFYAALGVVGRGPIGGYASGDTRFMHTLDNQTHHGGGFSGTGLYGLRRSYGGNPSTGSEALTDNSPDQGSNWFALDSTSTTWPQPDLGPTGAAFLQIRRIDEKGIQPARADSHRMIAWITEGLGGWTWTAPGTRSWTRGLTNPVWIAVNTYLRALGKQNATASEQEDLFDVSAAISAASICDATVDKIIGTGTETQFKFVGTIAEEKPLRDWLNEILASCLGYWTMADGKLRIGIRSNSSAVEAFTEANIIADSLQLDARAPQFNDLTIAFADQDYQYQQNAVRLVDNDSVSLLGPLRANINAVGICSKSQAARVLTTRLREEVGGLGASQQAAARNVRFRTTVLALNVEPGMVCSLTHADAPGNYLEFRVLRWRLNDDWSIDIEGSSTTDEMYDLTVGPKPQDVLPDPIPDRQWYPLIGSLPAAVSDVTIAITGDDLNFYIGISWTLPADRKNTKAYRCEAKYFGDAGLGYPLTDWMELGTVEDPDATSVIFGPFPRPVEEAQYVQVRVAGQNELGTLSAWALSNGALINTGPFGPPVPPTGISVNVLTPDDQRWGIDTTWSMPSEVGGTVSVQIYLRYYSDSGGTNAISDLILLGGADISDGHLVSGFWPRPTEQVYARVSARTLNVLGDASSFVTSAVITVPVGTGAQAPAPQPASNVVLQITYNDDNDTYGFIVSWTAGGGGTVGYIVQVRYYLDAQLSQPDSEWITLGSTWQTQLATDFWPRRTYDSWVIARVVAHNADDVQSAWAYSSSVLLQGLAPPNPPVYTSVEVLPNDAATYRVRIFWGSVPNARMYHLYLQFFADAACTDPDGEPRLVATSTRQQPVPPYIAPMEEVGPYPRNVADRWVKAGIAAARSPSLVSAIAWSAAAKIDKRIAPTPASSVNASLNEAVDGGVETFGFTITVTVPPGTYWIEAAAKFWKDAALTQPDSDWIMLGGIDPATGTLTTDRWPKASYPAWAKIRVRTVNEYEIPSDWLETSSALAIVAGSLNLDKAKLSTIGEGLQISAGKLKTKLDPTRFSTDGSGAITTAANRDLPIIAASQPGSTYLGSNIVYWAGQVYTWTGSTYQLDTNATAIKQQLQLNGLTAAEFAASYAPVRLLTYTPTVYMGDFIVNTTERRLYRWNGSAYARAMSGGDIKAELAVDQLTAAHIAAGAITTTQLAGNEIEVGPLSGRPPRFVVKDSYGVTIGAIGEFSGFTGLWASNARFGGSLSNPIINLSSSGAQITGANFELDAGSNGIVRINTGGALTVSLGSNMSAVTAAFLYNYNSGYYGTFNGYSLSLASGAAALSGNSPPRLELSGSSSYVNAGVYKVQGTTVIDQLRQAGFTSLLINSYTVIDSSRNFDAVSLKIGGTTVINSSRQGDFADVRIGSSIVLDSSRNLRLHNVYNENIFLGGITIQKWFSAVDANGNYLGKVPIIP